MWAEIRKILEEAAGKDHYYERLYDRFLDVTKLPVCYEATSGINATYDVVGYYKLPDNIKEQVRKGAEIIEQYNFPNNKDFGIKLAEVNIMRNAVEYMDERAKAAAANKPLFFIDHKTKSVGNVIFVIVRKNVIETIMYVKSTTSQDPFKLRVDHVAKISTVQQGKIR